MARACAGAVALSLTGVLLQLTGLVLFVLGFFPVKPALTGISGAESAFLGCQNNNEDLAARLPSASYQEASGVPRQFDRLVFMVVDGMPAEFVLGRGGRPPPAEIIAAMPFTHSLLSSGKAYGYRAKAAPPTVTMPRLKAMTSGAIAGFLDVAFNFNTQALLDDNLIVSKVPSETERWMAMNNGLGQLMRAGWKMVMLGDETWLKLFPNTFHRHDGVSSFFVKDTIEVDHNVTRHLDVELAAMDWDLLVLHYLGLDHVGHLGGRSSLLMAPKLKEMDDVVQRIYEQLISSSAERRTLLMVGSDHGMTDGGNHGGASYQEADALAIFVPGEQNSGSYGDICQEVCSSDQIKNAEASAAWSSFQVDLVPTLALLLGVPIPKSSVGALLPQLFTTLSLAQQLRTLELNAWQLFRLLRVRYPKSLCVNNLCSSQPGDSVTGTMTPTHISGGDNDKEIYMFCELFNQAIWLHSSWRVADCTKPISEKEVFPNFEAARDAYIAFLKPASEWLARGTTEKHIPFMIAGGGLMVVSTMLLFLALFFIYQAKSLATKDGQSHLLEKIVAIGGICIHAGSLASSSFVEEEQYTWHFLVCTMSLTILRRILQLNPTKICQQPNQSPSSNATPDVAGLHKFASNETLSPGTKSTSQGILAQSLGVAGILLFGRLLQAWHCGGVNWTHLPDIARWLDTASIEVSTSIRYAALCFVTISSIVLILSPAPQAPFRRVIAFSIFLSALLIFIFVRATSTGRTSSVDALPTLAARAVFGVLGITALCGLVISPWTVPLHLQNTRHEKSDRYSRGEANKGRSSNKPENFSEHFPLEFGVHSAMYTVGCVYVSCWCLLQLLLQQSVNAGPVALLLGQLLVTVLLFRNGSIPYNHWFPVLVLQWIGTSGHFALGNSNTLATVDVAGAYIGLSSHSTVLSGILAFIITYASPFLFMLGMLLLSCRVPIKSDECFDLGSLGLCNGWLLEALALPCILPLALNGVILVAFTVILTLMQDHLFVWSVFSPKYLYVCAATVCTTLGALVFAGTSTYSTLVILKRAHWQTCAAHSIKPSGKAL